MNNKAYTNYVTAKKKLYFLGAIWCVIVVLLIVTLKSSPLGLYGTLSVVVTMTIYVMFMLRKTAKSALCSNCNSDLFQLIEYSKYNKFKFNYCPHCGYEIDIYK